MAVTKQKATPLDSVSFSQPQEVRQFPMGHVELIKLGDVTFGRATFEPGWRWSTHMRTTAGTPSCQCSHLGMQLSGTMHVKMDNGVERDITSGQVVNIPPGHDAWVVGNEPVLFIDITGMENYAIPRKAA